MKYDQKKLREKLTKLRNEKDSEQPRDQWELDKFQIATTRFIDTVHGHLSGNHLTTSIDNARATCELMSGLTEHLKKRNHIPSDISLIYSFTFSADIAPNEKATPEEILEANREKITANMYKSSRKLSNGSKHADKDAHKTLSYDAAGDLDHLIFNMVVDYETLHCALIKQGLLDNANEKLYTIQSSHFSGLRGYQKLFYPQQDEIALPGKASNNPLTDLNLRIMHAIALNREAKECSVPAGAAICALYRGPDRYMAKNLAQKIRELGIWPVDTQTNARIKREILATPTPQPR